ncbi:MAG: hypothetical protein JWP63_2013 [Candidatus Solibacter sp.]|nr:hypothetical protein [Candidatus Solibacter sp.]
MTEELPWLEYSGRPTEVGMGRHDVASCTTNGSKDLIAAGQETRADLAALPYLHRLEADDLATGFMTNRVKFWAALIQRHASALHDSDRLLQSLLRAGS